MRDTCLPFFLKTSQLILMLFNKEVRNLWLTDKFGETFGNFVEGNEKPWNMLYCIP